jgi:hypothetical protein
MRARRGIRILLWTVLVLVLAGGAGITVLLTVPAPLERWLQARLLLALRQHYQADVQLQNLHVTLIPAFGATADNFVLPHRGSPGLPPLITVKHLEARAALPQLLRSPIHLSWLNLDGLVIQVGGNRKGQPAAAPAPLSRPRHRTRLANFVIDKVDADGTKLYVLRKDPTREPLQWDLRKLSLRSAGIGQPMTFTAELTNPTPPGLIEAKGRFGPWDFDETSATKVSGHYTFQHADLSVFNGIAGILSSSGDYQGVLHNIVVDGTTDVPDFELDRGGQPVHLTTQFHAIVDGTNGNTYLQPVKAHFRSTDIVTNGEVARSPGQKGKSIILDVDIEQGRLQDVLALAAKSEPPALTGGLALKTKLLLPPGKDRVLQKMLLHGSFNVSGARFTDEKVKNAIAALSRRGQGKPNDTSISDVPANFAGDFSLGREALRFNRLQFVVPGAMAQMKGSYGLHSEAVDFQGDVRLKATVSHTMKGSKRWLLVPFDPLLKKHGAGTYLPVAITGTRAKPDVKLQWKTLF